MFHYQFVMDIRSLECAIAVADELHFRRAAERVHLTQPALSQRIRTLEAELGFALFGRDRHSVSLTVAGAAFIEPARRAVREASLAKTLALRAMRGDVGKLTIGFTVIAFYGRLPSAVQAFRHAYPDVAVQLIEMNSPDLEDALAQGRIDVGVLHPPLTTPGLTVHELPAERLVLALPASHRLARQSKIRLAELDGEPFLSAPRSIGPTFYDRSAALFQQEGASPNIVQEVTPMTTLTGLVAAGVGMGLVTEGIAQLSRPGVAFRPLEPAPPALPLAIAWLNAEPTPTARKFIDVVAAAFDAEEA